MPIVCQTQCKAGIPIPFIGILCTHLPSMLCKAGEFDKTTQGLSGGDACQHSENPQRTKQGSGITGSQITNSSFIKKWWE